MKNKIIKFKPFYCSTNGSSLWSSDKKKVKVYKLYPSTVWDGYVTFEASFLKKDWNVNKLGLIYTDKLWIKEFRNNLVKLGVPRGIANTIDYTEQGMQGDNYVSLETNNNNFAKLMCWKIEKINY